MVRYHRAARSKYEQYLREKKSETQLTKKQKEKEKLRGELVAEKKMLPRWEAIIERLRKEADSLAVHAEKEKKLHLLTESNVTRKRVAEYEENIVQGKPKIRKIEDSLKDNKVTVTIIESPTYMLYKLTLFHLTIF